MCRYWKSGGLGVGRVSMPSGSERTRGSNAGAPVYDPSGPVQLDPTPCPASTTGGTAALCCALECCAVCEPYLSIHWHTRPIQTILAFIVGSIPPLLWSVLMYIPSFSSLLCWLCAIFHTSVPSSCISLAFWFYFCSQYPLPAAQCREDESS